MTHPLVVQLRFARSEWVRGLDGVTDEEGEHRFFPMNSIGWMVGHLAWQEHQYWVRLAQGENIAPELDELVGPGRPATTPPLDEMWATWSAVIRAADEYLDTVTSEMLLAALPHEPRPFDPTISAGTRLLRNTYHYWYHLGEALSVRQQFGHTSLPQFVGNMSSAVYQV
ncbi:MAG: DinB family protein [Anaerolineae bacterium]|nr:DinB family protein [Anaerolineae bacterium]